MKGILTGFKSLNLVIFNRLKKEKHHTHYHFTLLKVPWTNPSLKNPSPLLEVGITTNGQTELNIISKHIQKCKKNLQEQIGESHEKSANH